MNDITEIRNQIDAILKAQQKQTDTAAALGFLVGLAVGGAAGWIAHTSGLEGFWPAGVGILGLVVAVGAVAGALSEAAARRAVAAYRQAFPDGSQERQVANGVLAAIGKPPAAEILCQKLRIRSVKQQRIEEEKQERERKSREHARELEAARKAFPITSSFLCGKCRAAVDVACSGQVVTCGRCGTGLRVPVQPVCPGCASRRTGVITERSTPKQPSHKGKLASLLMYGPAGLVGGAILDGITNSLTGASSAGPSEKHVFHCSACGRKWAVALPGRNDETH